MNSTILTPTGESMGGKPVLQRNAKTILNFNNHEFQEKLLCDGITGNPGDACPYDCSYCYVADQMRRLLKPALGNTPHHEVVIRRANPLGLLRAQLFTRKGKQRFTDPNDRRVVYMATLVDCAANLRLARETAELASLILEYTPFQIRLLSKSNLFPRLVEWIPERFHHRLIFGVSTGTLDDDLAAAIEQGAARVSKRLEALHWLQDRGFRTFGMICPSIPQHNYLKFSEEMAQAIRVEHCEHVWAEVINLRGQSFVRTLAGLREANFLAEADRLAAVCGPGSRPNWEAYARATFEAHTHFIPATKLRFLQYHNASSHAWWKTQVAKGAILLGKSP
jgi:DNA repair photolyase